MYRKYARSLKLNMTLKLLLSRPSSWFQLSCYLKSIRQISACSIVLKILGEGVKSQMIGDVCHEYGMKRRKYKDCTFSIPVIPL